MTGTEGPTEGRVALVWDEQMAAYDFGPQHPLAPVRVELTIALIRALRILDGKRVFETTPGDYDEAELTRLHRASFVEAVRRASADPSLGADLAHGLGPGDNPIFAGMHRASMEVCAASKEGARQVWEGDTVHAFNPAGGLHHAMPDRAAGFCVYNDPAVAIDWLLEHGAERICYVDIDVHHGDGVETMFRDDPRVLTISLHESGRFLFPGTGAADDIGGPEAQGSVVNLPLFPGTTGEIWRSAWEAAGEPLVRAFKPDILVTQLGCDTHVTDPLAHLALTVDDFAAIVARLHGLAHELCEGRWLALGGGGYQLVRVVPRAWTIAFAEMAGTTLPVETPMSWRELAGARTGQDPPSSFIDDRVEVSDAMAGQARRAAAESVETIRQLVFPRHGVRA